MSYLVLMVLQLIAGVACTVLGVIDSNTAAIWIGAVCLVLDCGYWWLWWHSRRK